MDTTSSAKHEPCARVQQRMRHVCSESCLQHVACFHWPREGGRGDGESVRAHAGSGRKGARDRAKGRQCEYSGAGLRAAGPREGANFRVCPNPSAYKETRMTASPSLHQDTLYAFEGRGGKNLSDIENLDVEWGQNFRDVRYQSAPRARRFDRQQIDLLHRHHTQPCPHGNQGECSLYVPRGVSCVVKREGEILDSRTCT
jgi:hypothetical protein